MFGPAPVNMSIVYKSLADLYFSYHQCVFVCLLCF